MRTRRAARRVAGIGSLVLLAACATVAPSADPTGALLTELRSALHDYRASSASTARPPPQPSLALLTGVSRSRLEAALGRPDGCPGKDTVAACARAMQWRYRYFAPLAVHDENGQIVVRDSFTVDLAVAFAPDDSIARAAWQLGR